MALAALLLALFNLITCPLIGAALLYQVGPFWGAAVDREDSNILSVEDSATYDAFWSGFRVMLLVGTIVGLATVAISVWAIARGGLNRIGILTLGISLFGPIAVAIAAYVSLAVSTSNVEVALL